MIGSVLLATALAVPWTVSHLGVNSDVMQLLSPRLPFRQRYDELARLFPTTANALLVLVEGEAPARTRQAAEQLAEKLRADPVHFRDVSLAGSGAFFERNGLLYRSVDELEELTDQLARAQPLIAALERSPRLTTLSSVLERSLDHPDALPDEWSVFLDRLSEATVQVFAEAPTALSWADLLLSGSAFEPARRQVLVVDPVLDFRSPVAARDALAAVREHARALGAGVGVRITGNPALSFEEMRGLARDVGRSSIGSFAAVVVLLLLALRSGRLAASAAATLAVGLVWTCAFAAAAVGRVNLISVTFAVLYIGLGIDFAIHLLAHYGALRQGGAPGAAALDGAVRNVGTSLVLCAVTTAIGFYAFLPTDYVGVAELGLISGTGVLVILALSLTFLPALLAAFHTPEVRGAPPLPAAGSRTRRPALTCAAFLALGLACVAALPGLRFDSDAVHLRDPGTESVRAFEDLLADAGATSPWQADVVMPDLASADALAVRLRALPEVGSVITLSSLVPEDQEEKREILTDAALMLGERPALDVEPVSRQEEMAALRRFETALAAPRPFASRRIAESAALLRDRLDAFLDRAERDGETAADLAALEQLLFGELEHQLGRLRRALEPGRIGLADLPRELVHALRAESGEARVQIHPRESLAQGDALPRFVDAVLATEPRATGSAVNLVEFGRETVRALRSALAGATAAIALLVWLLWRRLSDTLTVLLPLLLGGLFSAGAVRLLGLSFNFANVIVLPLLLGIGVDSGIHVVHRWRAGAGGDDRTTRRAILYSALTTIASFGTLAFSSHRGVASLGLLLVVAMLAMLACNLVFLPALLALRAPPGEGRSTA